MVTVEGVPSSPVASAVQYLAVTGPVVTTVDTLDPVPCSSDARLWLVAWGVDTDEGDCLVVVVLPEWESTLVLRCCQTLVGEVMVMLIIRNGIGGKG